VYGKIQSEVLLKNLEIALRDTEVYRNFTGSVRSSARLPRHQFQCDDLRNNQTLEHLRAVQVREAAADVINAGSVPLLKSSGTGGRWTRFWLSIERYSSHNWHWTKPLRGTREV
jgi:hypothetical protein